MLPRCSGRCTIPWSLCLGAESLWTPPLACRYALFLKDCYDSWHVSFVSHIDPHVLCSIAAGHLPGVL